MTEALSVNVADEQFEPVGEGALDDRNRLSLTKALEALRAFFVGTDLARLRFTIAVNRAGQVLLSPETPVPLREAWLFRNPEALARVRAGLDEAARGELHDLGSFGAHADDTLDD